MSPHKYSSASLNQAQRLESSLTTQRGVLAMQLAIICIVISGLVRYGSAIMCYECNSATNSYCDDAVLPKSLMRNCSEHDRGVTHTLCRKIVQHVEHSVNGRYPESRVIRSCGWDETKYKGMCYHRAGFGGRQEVCSCLSDYCNGSQGLIVSNTLFATVLLTYSNKILCQ